MYLVLKMTILGISLKVVKTFNSIFDMKLNQGHCGPHPKFHADVELAGITQLPGGCEDIMRLSGMSSVAS
jgi:hypothetical protein